MPTTHLKSLVIGSMPILKSISTGTADVTYDPSVICNYMILEVATGHASNAIILPVIEGRHFYIVNKSAANALVKRAGQTTPITVATGKSALIYCDGTDYKRLTADA